MRWLLLLDDRAVVLTLRVPFPQTFEFRSPRKDLPWRKPVQQVATVEFFGPLHECIEFRGTMTCKGQAPSLDFQHMLIPRLDPAAIEDPAISSGCPSPSDATPQIEELHNTNGISSPNCLPSACTAAIPDPMIRIDKCRGRGVDVR